MGLKIEHGPVGKIAISGEIAAVDECKS